MDTQALRADDAQDPVAVLRTTRAPAAAPSGEPLLVDPPEHNVVFTSLVTGDKDIVGLIAYSIYKQNKYDWLLAFSRTKGRMPDEVEADSYLLGESTARRLATYRHLAEATLAGSGPSVTKGDGPIRPNGPAAKLGPSGRAGSAFSRPVLAGLAAAVALLLVLFWFLHGGTVPPKP